VSDGWSDGWSDGSNPVESWWAFQCDGDGNLCADPRLLDPTALDFRVAADSPVIDAGTSNVPVEDDIDGTARPQGSAFDLGAYEQPSGPVPPSAAIGLDIGDGELPLTVHFSDRSGGLPTSWDWAFGDGATSTEQHPSHTYTDAGSYGVTLTVGNDQGSDSTALATPIVVRAPSLDRPLLEDGFETGLAWTSSDIAEWYTGTPKIGTHAVQLRRRGAIATSVSTVGYSDIQVHFALGAKSLDKGVEFVVAEWFDGSAWTELVRISDGEEDGQLHEHSFALPAAAANNPSLGLRFALHGSGGQDYAYIDDVLITGREGQPQPQPPIVYHVSSTGDDANDGSEAAPLRGIQAALDLAQPGDSVMVQSGTYNETLVFPRSGAADAWITLQAQPGHAVTIDATGIPIADYWQGAVTIADVSYVRVQGLRVEHSARTGIIANRASHVEILDNQTYDTVLSGIGVWRSDNVRVDGNRVELAVNGGEQECISVSISSNVAVTDNEVLNDGAGTAGGEGIDIKDGSSQVLVSGNHVHDLDELGIYVDAWDSDTSDILIEDNRVHHCNNHGIAIAAERGGRVDRVTIRNNLTYANARMGITIGDWDSGWPHPMADILIVNNTSVDNGPGAVWGAGIAVLNGEATGVTIRNNLVANNAYAQILDESGGAEITADHNLIWGASGSGDEITGSDAVLADPRLVDAVNADYRPRFDSPAVDAANDLDAPTTDLDGMARPAGAGIDIGAYEYQPGPVPPRAALSVDRTAGEAPLTVQFTDGSAGEPTTWLWSFGDGTTSTEQHPEHSYSAPGGFDVTLTVTNDQGSDSLTESDLITVTAPGTGIALIDDGFESGLDWVTSGDAALYTGTPNHDGTALQLLKQGMAEIAVSTEGLGQLQLAFALGAKSLDNVGEYLVWNGGTVPSGRRRRA
jgi:PKD repeat protein